MQSFLSVAKSIAYVQGQIVLPMARMQQLIQES